jgi:hypothetical protein
LTGLISKFNWGTESNKILTTKKYAVRSMSAKQGHYESLWVETFRQLYGKDAVLASEDTNIDKDAKIMGFRPIRLHHAVRDYLSDWGIISAGDIDNAKEYRWIDLSELTAEEREVLSSAPQLSQILGESADVEVRVYSGLFLKSGREIESSAGICITESDEKKYIGIKKCRLGCLEDFAETYLHELGHQVTGANDADRRFSGYFIRRVAEHALEQLKKGKPEEKE